MPSSLSAGRQSCLAGLDWSSVRKYRLPARNLQVYSESVLKEVDSWLLVAAIVGTTSKLCRFEPFCDKYRLPQTSVRTIACAC